MTLQAAGKELGKRTRKAVLGRGPAGAGRGFCQKPLEENKGQLEQT